MFPPKCYGQVVAAEEGTIQSNSPLIKIPLDMEKTILDTQHRGLYQKYYTTPYRGIKLGVEGLTHPEEKHQACLAHVAT